MLPRLFVPSETVPAYPHKAGEVIIEAQERDQLKELCRGAPQIMPKKRRVVGYQDKSNSLPGLGGVDGDNPIQIYGRQKREDNIIKVQEYQLRSRHAKEIQFPGIQFLGP